MPKIITRYDPKPIPDRRFDWSAWEDGGSENMVGYGRTEQEAKDDLRRLQTEMAEWHEEMEQQDHLYED